MTFCIQYADHFLLLIYHAYSDVELPFRADLTLLFATINNLRKNKPSCVL